MKKAKAASLLLVSLVVITNACAQPDSGPWPMFKHDARRTGRSSLNAGPQTVGLAWSYEADHVFSSPPAVSSDGRVYAGSWDHHFYALTSEGKFLWSYTAWNALWRAPAAIADDGRVYVGADNNRIYAFTDDVAGLLSWSYETGDWIWDSGVAIGSDGRIYIGCFDNKIYALTSEGSFVWAYETGGNVASSPAISSEGNVFAGSLDDRLYALESSGVLLWSYDAGPSGDVWSPAVGSDGTVYAGSYANRVYAINSEGALGWSYETGEIQHSSPSLGSDDRVFIGSLDGRIYALTSAGALLWSYETGFFVISSPAVGAENRVYVGSHDDNVYALTSGGTLVWSYLTGQSVFSSPAIGPGGRLYVGSDDYRMYAFEEGAPTPTPTITPTPCADYELSDKLTIITYKEGYEGHLIIFPDSSTMSIDCQHGDPGGITTISHFHQDHCGEACEDSGQYHRNNTNPGQVIYENGDVKVTVVVTNKRILGEVPPIPAPTPVACKSSIENRHSMALLVQYRGFDYLTAGDMYGTEEKKLGEELEKRGIHIDVLKLSHHGSDSSTYGTSSLKFLQYVSPEYATVAGTASKPTTTTLSNCVAAGVQRIYYAPVKDLTFPNFPEFYGAKGDIEISTDGYTYSISGGNPSFCHGPFPVDTQVTLNGMSFTTGDQFTATFQLNEAIERSFTAFAALILPNGAILNALTLDAPIRPVVKNVQGLPAGFSYPLLSATIPDGVPKGEYELVTAFFDPTLPITSRADAFLDVYAKFTIE